MKRVALSPLLLAALALAACGKQENQAPASAPSPSATANAPAPAGTAPARPATTPTPAAPASAPAAPAPASTAPAAAGTSASAAPADQGFRVDSVQLGDAVTAAHKVRTVKDSFEPGQKTLYASVATLGKTAGATLSARWSYLEGKGQPVSTISQSIATDGPAITTFKVLNPNAWPEGKYKVEISLDGKPVASQTFQVKASS
ncbi:hypothetical protein [Frateuria defendens]|uniref:hypothetical protein n=1 Tax=Frateuria defendens TaxID=2219559 RepID=UPI00066FE546|nr:hypothetical protein [Frateuria defendens]